MNIIRLTSEFYQKSAIEAAPLLLGKLLCRRLPCAAENGAHTEKIMQYRITETEAYYGESDTACHASKGKTPRTQVMYRCGGYAYIYLCYGIHNLFNVVTGPQDHPEAVLIRGIEGFYGPGRLTKALHITRSLNEEDLTSSQNLWLEDDGFIPSHTAAKRIGINYAAPEDIEKLWCFTVHE